MSVKELINRCLKLFYPIFKTVLPYDLYAYLAVGAGNTLLNILLFILFFQFILPPKEYDFFNLKIASYTIALVLAFVATVPTGYWLNKTFAFSQAKEQQTATQLGKYFLVVLQGLASDYLVFKGLIVFVGLDPTWAKIISTAIVLTINYMLQKYFTFNSK